VKKFCCVMSIIAAALSGNASTAGASPMQTAVTGTTIDPGLGVLHHAVSTGSEQAQKFFDQGLTLNYALNHEAAVQSYRRALQLDPDLAMAYWGIAHAMGPDINQPMTPEHLAAANEAMAKAVALASHASPREREYIEALRKRYSTDEPADRTPFDAAYKNAMAELSARAPDDVDAAVLYAESLLILNPWKWWRADGTPEEGTQEAVAALQRALQLQPNHIGANHYYVHAVEMSPHPETGLVAAHRLETLAPSAGHLVHMPAHIYMRTGEYLDAARVNESAASADEHVHAMGPKSEYLPYYHGHNLHFLAVSYSYAGAGNKAMAAAIKLVDTVQGDAESLPEIIDYYCSNQFQVGVLFDRWAEVLRLPELPASMPLSRAFYHFARSLAFAGTGQSAQAQVERARFIAAASAMGPKVAYGYNPAQDVMAVALPYLDGRLALMAGDFKTAAANFRQAANAEDKLSYDEPPDWYLASNWMLGTVLLKLGDAAGAEAAFRSDLKHNIRHGRSLAGLAAALRKQNKTAEADAAQKRFEYAWRGADTSAYDR
jgi:tetratricopeptide (TPR) repeat protein